MLDPDTLEYLVKHQRKRILQECRAIAVVGAKPDPQATSYAQIETLLGFGVSVHPIMAGFQRFAGVKCCDALTSVPGHVDIVLVFPNDEVDLNDLACQARDKGVGAFWIEDGELSAEIRATLAQAKIQVIEQESLVADYNRHFPFAAEPTKPSRVKKRVTVGERMTRHPITIKRSDRIREALDRMKAGHFRHLPVINDQGRLIGIVSDRDLRLIHPSLAYAASADVQREIWATAVEEVAFFDPITTSPDETLERAAATMLRWNVGALPVVRNGDTLTGIITHTDFLREFVAREGEQDKSATTGLGDPETHGLRDLGT